ncbi:hypothetical protein E4198_14575 [Streptomyces sp. RKND-216]|uniref:hypothetical protein n=1 Tax=Streptomyces sp. RKND-216 TaxID=2562581 RepID=UPI00109DAC50|nr:hypothetical protein [Streptomyces sp. RKND-216]THA25758.1 hypothetical protein E4198_14575 [Streptomyces sp. RKND-216]
MRDKRTAGRWLGAADDFVHLAIEDGTLGRIGGIQLYTGSHGTVYFRYDPDGPPSLILTRTTAS